MLVCLGPGGVGKTTTAAALGMAAAAGGRRVALITVDPARRLADALGLARLGHVPERLTGPWETKGRDGELWACMLDTQKTFERLVHEYATCSEQADRVVGHRLFRQLTTSLSGTHEYLAIDQLWHLHQAGRYDLVIVDTPPAHHAIDLLESATRLVRFIDHPLYRGLLAPRGRLARLTATAARGAAIAIGRLIGLGLVEEVADFFSALGEMDAGFRARAADMDALLHSPEVGYVLVTTPRVEALEQTAALAARLPSTEATTTRSWLLINRCMPDRFARSGRSIIDPDPSDPAGANLLRLAAIAGREADLIDDWCARLAVPVLDRLDERSETIGSVEAVWALAGSIVGWDLERV